MLKVGHVLLSVIVQFRGTYLMSNFFPCRLAHSSLFYLNLLVPITSKVQFFSNAHLNWYTICRFLVDHGLLLFNKATAQSQRWSVF